VFAEGRRHHTNRQVYLSPHGRNKITIRWMPRFSAEIAGLELTFETSLELFSPRNIDPGTAAMLRWVNIEPQDKVLDPWLRLRCRGRLRRAPHRSNKRVAS
jgi:16S rRNA G1207 methylase RsmC